MTTKLLEFFWINSLFHTNPTHKIYFLKKMTMWKIFIKIAKKYSFSSFSLYFICISFSIFLCRNDKKEFSTTSSKIYNISLNFMNRKGAKIRVRQTAKKNLQNKIKLNDTIKFWLSFFFVYNFFYCSHIFFMTYFFRKFWCQGKDIKLRFSDEGVENNKPKLK